MIKKYTEAHKEIEKPEISNKYDLQSWKTKAINLICRVYKADSKQEEQINLINFINYPVILTNLSENTSDGGNNSKHCQKQASEIITSFIVDLEKFGIPERNEPAKSNGINISLNQNQTININIIWKSIKDELTWQQVKELEEILNEETEPKKRKQKIISKISSFGKDLATNILASIITNPAIYGG